MTALLPSGNRIKLADRQAILTQVDSGVTVRGRSLSIRVGRGWRPMRLTAASRPSIDGAKLVAFWGAAAMSDEAAPSLQIFTAKAPAEMSAHAWLKRFAKAMGLDLKASDSLSPALADGLVTFIFEQATFTGRLAVRFYGPEIVAALAFDTAARYPKLCELLALLVRGISVDGLEPQGPVAPLQTVRIGPAVTFNLPEAWTAQFRAVPDNRRAAVDLTHTRDEALVGRMQVRWLVPELATDLSAQVSSLTKAFAGFGLERGALVYQQKTASLSPSGFELVVNRLHRATLQGTERLLEYQTLVLERADAHLYIGYLAPGPLGEPLGNAVCRRALDIILETVC